MKNLQIYPYKINCPQISYFLVYINKTISVSIGDWHVHHQTIIRYLKVFLINFYNDIISLKKKIILKVVNFKNNQISLFKIKFEKKCRLNFLKIILLKNSSFFLSKEKEKSYKSSLSRATNNNSNKKPWVAAAIKNFLADAILSVSLVNECSEDENFNQVLKLLLLFHPLSSLTLTVNFYWSL